MPQAFARNTFLGFISGAAVALAGFIAGTIATRVLGPEGIGVYAYGIWCLLVAGAIADLGIGLVLQRFIPNLRADGRRDEANGLIGATARVSALATVVVGLLLMVWLYWPGGAAMTVPSQTPRIILTALVLAAFIVKQMADVYLAYLKGEQRFGELAKLSSVSALVRLVVTVLGAWLFGVAGAVAGYIAASVLPASRTWQLIRKKPSVGQGLRRHVLRFALTGWSVGVIGILVWGRSEIAFLEHYAGLSTVGLFAAASMLTDMAVLLPPLFLSALLPYLSEQHGLGAHEQMHRLYRAMTGLVALVVIPSCIGLAAIAPVCVPMLFGADFADAVPAATVLLIAAAISSLGTTTTDLIYSTGRIAALLLSNAVGLVGTIVLGFVVIPRFGLMGAAWSRAAVQVLVVALETWYATRWLGFTLPFRALGAITLAGVIQGAVANVLCTCVGGVTSLVLAIPVAAVVYVVALRALRALPMVDPELIDTAVRHAPRQVRRGVLWILKLVSPDAKGPSAP
jgi:O-antigen/teichoic acid export membrane protein